tara:strand:- start:1220 stop:1897 length:678 start_codon:yes stop_codon:yes gene_type:complete
MATINVNRQGSGTGVTSSNFNTARTSAASSVTDGVSGNQSQVVQYFQSSGRGGGSIRFKRVFLHFDTSGITGTLSAAHIDVTGYGSSSVRDGDTIMLKSTAFGGDGGTALSTSDFYSTIDYSTLYSTEKTSFASGNNEYTLTTTALADIKNNDHFTLAIVEHDADYSNTDTGNAALDISIAFGTTITLDYTLVAGYGNSVNGVASASISRVNGVATANISKVNGV